MVVLHPFSEYGYSIMEGFQALIRSKAPDVLWIHCIIHGVQVLHQCIWALRRESGPGTSSEFLKYKIYRNSVTEDRTFRSTIRGDMCGTNTLFY